MFSTKSAQAVYFPRPEVTDCLTESERTGYAAQELAEFSIHFLDDYHKRHGNPYPVNADHTTMHDTYA